MFYLSSLPRFAAVSFTAFLAVAAAVVSLSPITGYAAEANWQQTGWGGGGYFYSSVYHPTKDGVIYLGGDVAGVYKTEDHGRNWRMINNGIAGYGVFSLAVDQRNPETVYAATEDGLCKSTNGGETWVTLPKTGRKALRITGEKGKSIRSIAVDPTNSNIVYAASPAGKVYKSIDGGQTWEVSYERKVDEGAPANTKPATIYSVTIAPKYPNVIIAATHEAGLVLSNDSGATWTELDAPKKAACATFDPSNPQVIYGAFFEKGIWKSVDAGKTWTDISTGIPKGTAVREVAVSAANANDIYAIGKIGWTGVFVLSNDGGKTWKNSTTIAVNLNDNPTLDNVNNGKAQLSAPTNVNINPRNAKEIFVSANWRNCISNDGGLTWNQVDRGADISCITDIRFNAGKAYVTAMDEGTFASDNHGKSWRQLWPLKHITELSGHNWRVAVNTVNGAEQIIATASPWSETPNRIIRSEDGGKTFQVINAGLPTYIPRPNTMWGQGYARALAVDPNDPKTVYVGIDGDPADGKSGGGIFKSVDSGVTWKQLAQQPGSRRMYYALTVDPTNSKRLFWGACGDGGGLYRSEDGGDSWKQVFSDETWVWNVHVTGDGTIYTSGKNLWRSTDHGATWKQVTKGLKEGRALVGIEVHPRDPKTIWISTTAWDNSANGGIYKTSDGGTTWTDITGNIPYVRPQVIRFNPVTNELWAGYVGLYKLKQ